MSKTLLSLSQRFIIRPLARDDEPFLWEMLYQAIYVPPHLPPPERSIIDHPDLARYISGWGRVDDIGVAAVDADELVGAAWLRLMVGSNQGYGYVDDRTPELSVAVLPEYRGQGLGTQLLERLLQQARTQYPAVSLSVSMDNPARRLYEHLGFEAVSSDGTSLTMKLDLLRRSPIEHETGDRQ
jgi:ribosomal protein S18 acetylase RimI-like enzyme